MAHPTTHLLNRITLGQKFALLGLLAATLTGVGCYAYVSVQLQNIRLIGDERGGLRQARALLELAASLARHRGASTALLNGNLAMADEAKAAKTAADQQLAAAEAAAKPAAGPAAEGLWADMLRDWARINQKLANKTMAANDNFQAHSALIAKVLEAQGLVLERAGLLLGAGPDRHFLLRAVLVNGPLLLEQLGQAQGFGASVLTRLARPPAADKAQAAAPTLTVQERVKLGVMAGLAQARLAAAGADMAAAFKHQPPLQATLAPQLGVASEWAHKAIRLTEAELVNKAAPVHSSTDYFKLYGRAIDEWLLWSAQAADALDALYAGQLNAANRRLGQWSAAIVGLFMLCGLLAALVTRSITRPVAVLVGVVNKLAAGDNSVRANLSGQDEIGLLARQLDEMIDQREAMRLSMEQENEALNNSIIELLMSVARLSQKDLTVTLAVADDITGPLADALNLLASQTAAVMRQVTQAAAEVAAVSAAIDRQSAQIVEVASQEQRQVAQTAAELGAAATAMQDIAGLAASCDDAAQHAIHNTRQAQAAVLDTVAAITGIRDTIRETEKRIKRLGERSQEIGGVVNLINEIAERTHVLALNAAMHAASAGEAGRGFAVVATEVQKLAENAREATSRISALVNNIQLETADTIQTMNEAIAQVVRGTRLAQQAGDEMGQTGATTAKLVGQVRAIAQSSGEQARTAGQLLLRARQTEDATEQTHQALHQQSRQTGRLAELSAALVAAVGVFVLPGDGQGQGQGQG